MMILKKILKCILSAMIIIIMLPIQINGYWINQDNQANINSNEQIQIDYWRKNYKLTYMSPIQDEIIKVETYYQSTFILTKMGKVYGVGYGTNGIFGQGNTSNLDSVTLLDLNIPETEKVIDIAVGVYHSVILTDVGNVYTSGIALALGYPNPSTNRYHKVPFPNNEKIIQISAGNSQTLALTENKKVYGWGHGIYGKLGQGNALDQYSPVEITGFDNRIVKQVIAGYDSSYVLTEDNRIYAFGYNGDSTLGLGENVASQNTPTLQTKVVPEPIEYIYASRYTFFIKTIYNEIYVWGHNNFGQAGTNSTGNVTEPEKISMPEGEEFQHVAGGYLSTIFVMKSGKVFACGSQQYHNMGLPVDAVYTNLTLINLTDKRFVQVTVSFEGSVLLSDNGELYSAGSDLEGMQGNGPGNNPNTTYQIMNINLIFVDEFTIIHEVIYLEKQDINEYLPSFTIPNLSFVGWYSDDALSLPAILDFMPSTDYVVYAKWEDN